MKFVYGLTLFSLGRYNKDGDAKMNNIHEKFKALSDATRLKIYMLLTERTLCACQVLDKLDISQPTLSHHMKILENAGLVNSDKRGTWTHYHINEDTVRSFIDFFQTIRDTPRDEEEVFSCEP